MKYGSPGYLFCERVLLWVAPWCLWLNVLLAVARYLTETPLAWLPLVPAAGAFAFLVVHALFKARIDANDAELARLRATPPRRQAPRM